MFTLNLVTGSNLMQIYYCGVK